MRFALKRTGAQLRKNMVTEKLKMMALAEKVGLVRGDAVDHLQTFFSLRIFGLEVVIILRERGEIKVTQSLGETRSDELAFGVTQKDSGLLQDQGAKSAKFFISNGEDTY